MSDQMSTSRASFTCLGVLAAIIMVGLGAFYEIKEAIDERKQAAMPTRTPLPQPTPTSTPLPTPTEIVPKVVIKYDNGKKIEIQDWRFLYTYGERWDRAPRSGDVYAVEEKWSSDLHLQTVTRPGMTTNEVVIPAYDMKTIWYRWPAGESIPEIVILTKSGKEYASSLVPEVDATADSYFTIPDAFLADSPYVFDKRLYLVGIVLKDGQSEELRLYLNTYWGPNKDQQIEEIIFP